VQYRQTGIDSLADAPPTQPYANSHTPLYANYEYSSQGDWLIICIILVVLYSHHSMPCPDCTQ